MQTLLVLSIKIDVLLLFLLQLKDTDDMIQAWISFEY